jgi:hypothetical protein
MKIETVPQDVTFAGDFEQRDVAIGGVAWILDLFSDKIYSNKEKAVIRELSCNAYDSHVIAGTQKIPFDVHLPTSLEPWFLIRDYGVGLNDDEIANVFSAIGVSTKRDSNNLIGCMGVGSLSPYALVDSFTVKSYLNGEVRTYQCMRNEERIPKVIPLGVANTDEPNGLEIKLSVNNKINEFENQAINVFKFWDGVLPNINNDFVLKKCQSERDSYAFKGEEFALSSSWGEMYAVMGNVGYKIPYDLDEFNCDGYLKFDIGELDFDTSRENLEMTDKVRAAIKSKTQLIKSQLQDIAIGQIEALPTKLEQAILAYKLCSGKIGRFIKSEGLSKYKLPLAKEQVVCWSSISRRGEKFVTSIIEPSEKTEYYIQKPRMEARIREYFKNKPSSDTRLYIFKDLKHALDCNIPEENISDLDDLPKVVRSNSRSSKSKTRKEKVFLFKSYSSYNADCWTDHELDTSSGKEVVYVEISRWKPVDNYGSNSISGANYQLMKSIESSRKFLNVDIQLIGLKTSFMNSAKFRSGKFIHLYDYIKREINKVAPASYADISHDACEKIMALNSVIDSPCVSELLNIVNSSKKDRDLINFIELHGLFSTDDITKDEDTEAKFDEFFKKYNMLQVVTTWDIKYNKEIVADYIGGTVKK